MEDNFLDKLVEVENLFECFSDALKYCGDESKNAAYLVTLNDIIYDKIQRLTYDYEHILFDRAKTR